MPKPEIALPPSHDLKHETGRDKLDTSVRRVKKFKKIVNIVNKRHDYSSNDDISGRIWKTKNR